MAKNTCLGISFNSQADKQGNFTREVSEILNIPEGLLVHGSIIKLAIEGYASYLGTQNNIVINPADLLELDKSTKEYRLKEEYKEGFKTYLQDKYTNKSVIIENASDIREEFKEENILRYSIENSKESANRLSQLITERFGNIVTILPLLDSRFLVYINNVVTAEEYINNLKQKSEENNILHDIKTDSEYQEMLDEMLLSRSKTDDFVYNFVTRILNVNPRYKVNENTDAFAYWFMEKDNVNPSDFANLTKRIFGYKVNLDTETRGKFLKSVKEALKNWGDNLQKMLQGNSDDKNYLSGLYNSLYKAQYNIKLLQRFLNHGLDKSSFTQDEINSIDELLLLPDNEITKQKVGFKIQKIKLGVSTTEQDIQRFRNRIFQQKLAIKNRIVALNVIDNIKDLVEKRLLAEYDSRSVKQETVKEKLLPLQDLYAAIKKTIASKKMESVGLPLFNKATETLSSYEELQNAVFLMYPQYENLLKLMHKANPELKIYIGGEPQRTPTGDVIPGHFTPGANELHLSNIADIYTVIHELAHSATYYGIIGLLGEDGVLFKESIGKFMDYIREYIKEKQMQPELFKPASVWGAELPADVYGFTNESEFIAELFGNPEFQELLDLIPAMDEKQFRSILGQIWDAIVKFLNSLMGENKLNKTALDLARELGSASMFLQQQHLDYIYKRLDEYKNHKKLNIVLQETQKSVPNFNKISDKTVAFGVELNKGGAKTMQSDAKKWQQSNSDGIVAYRKYQDTPKTFTPETVLEGWIGNPFSTKTKGKDTVQKFGEWLVTGNNFGEERANEEFRQAIIDKILATSEDAKILYYIELKNRPSHATVIGYLVRNKQLLQQSQSKTQSSKQISISTEGYRKGDPQRNPDIAYVFTENAQAATQRYDFSKGQKKLYDKYGYDYFPGTAKLNVSDVNGTNQAGIRTDSKGHYSENAFGIIVKKMLQDSNGKWLAKEGQFEDTTEDFEMFKDYNERFFNELDNSGLSKIVFPSQMALGKSALPKRFAEWLLRELKSRYGINSTIQKNTTSGYDGYGLQIDSVEQQPQQLQPQQSTPKPTLDDYVEEITRVRNEFARRVIKDKDFKNNHTYWIIDETGKHKANESITTLAHGSQGKGDFTSVLLAKMAFGNIFDAFVRDYFATDGKMIKGKTYPVIGSSSTKMFKALKKEVDKLKESFNKLFGEGKYKVLTKFESINGNEEFTVGGQMNGSYTAGTLDMLIVTDKGEVYIYDMKATMSDDKEFNTRANEEYQGQVELYRRFINANSKLQVKDSLESLGLIVANPYLEINGEKRTYLESMDNPTVNDEGEVLINGSDNFELYFTIRQNDLGGYVKYFNLLILLKNPKIRTATIKLLFAIPEVKQIVEGILKSDLTKEQKKQQLNEVKNAALTVLNSLKPLEIPKPVVPSFNPRRPVAQSLVLYIGRNMVKLISLYADTIAKNPAMLEKMGYSTLMKSTLEIPEGLTGNQVLKRYFLQLRPFFIKTLTNMYFKERQGDSPVVLALKRWFKGFTNVDGLVRRNLDIVLDRAFGEFMEIEDIKIADATYQTLEDVNYDISNLEEGALIYGFDSREKNYMDSISTLVRRKLATIMQFTYKRNEDGTYITDSDGMPIVDTLEVDGKVFKKQETDPYGFGMPVFKDKFDVVNFMLNMFHSCATSESLMRHIKEEMKNTPWLYEVYKMLVNDKTLQTQMMQSLHRNQTSYASIYSLEYTEPGEDGQPVKKTRYVIKNENSRARTEVLKSSMYRFYLSRLTSDLLKYNNNTQKYRLVLNDSIDNILQNIGNEKDFEKKKSLLISLLSDIGVNTSFINNYDKLLSKKGLNSLILKGIGKRRTGALRNLLENMANREFDYDTVSAYYTPLFMVLQLGMPNQYELSTRIGDKTYMTYSLVSYIEREIQRLAGKDIDVSDDLIFGENSIYRKYRQYNAGGENLFVNSILLEIADNKELRQYLQYYTLPAVDGKPLFKQNGKEYLMQILLGYFGINQENQTSFFFEDSTMKLNVALFRVGTMSDKPTSDFIQWRKEATLDLNSPRGDKGKQKMRDDITEKVSRYFWYELSRARSVVELVLNSPDTDVANIHIDRKKAKDFIEKIANKQKINRADLYENGKLKSYIEGSGMTFKYIPVLNIAFDYDANADRRNDNNVDNPEFYDLLNQISEDTLGDNSLLTKEQLETLSLAFVTLYLRKLNNENLNEEETKKIQSIFNKLYQYGMSLEFRNFLDAVDAQFQGNYEELQNSIKELTIGNREDFLEEFFYNDSLMAMNIYNILIGDPAYYKDSVDLQKRFAEVHSSSARPDITATVNLNTFADHDSERNNNTEIKLTDGKCRVVMIKDAIEQNEELALTIAEVFSKLEENARKEGRGKEADQFKIYKEIIPASLREGIEVTDGQAYSSPTGFWKKLHLLGDINIQKIDSALKSIREGKITPENIDIVILEFKPFIYSRVHKNGNTSLGDELVSLQIKDSEAMIMLAGAIIQGALEGNYIKDNPLVEMFNFMEASHYGKLKEYFEGKYDPKSVSIDDYRPDGIDTIAFLSAVKNGSWAVIDLNGKNSEQMRRELQKTVKMEIGLDGRPTGQLSWNDDFVHPMSFEDWGKQTENPAHMQDHELDIGSQIKMLSVSDLPDNFKVKIKGVEYDKQSFLNRYFKLLEEDYKAGIALVLDDLNIFEKYDKEQNRVITQDEKLADLVKKSILNDSKLNSELLEAFALEEYEENGMKKKRFKYPVGDPSIAPKFFSTVFNVIKDYVNRQKLPGGPIVQVAPYGMSDKLHLIDDNNNVISRETLFDKNGKIAKSIILEVYITPPTLLLLELLTKKDGSLMTVKEAKSKGILKDEDLELIGYRIPTEDKYSMYRMRIKGFLPREMGELIIMPREITWLSGSDYDIDKIFTMFRNYIYKKERNNKKLEEKTRMNDIFDMQWAALQHPSSVEKQLNHGDFSELGNLAKLISGSKRIGSTMYVQNQMRFHTENAAGKEFVGIAALNNVSHVISNFANIHFKGQFGFNFQILMRPKDDGLAPIRFDLSTFADDTQKVRIDPAYSPADGSRLSRNIGMYVGASADNAKNALLGKLNTRPITATLAMGMLRLGFPVSTVSYMLSMPKIVELSNKAQLEGKRIENLIHLEALQLDETLVTGNESILSELEMLDFTTGKNQESSIQDAVIVFLDLISPYCKAISDTNSLLSLNSIKNAVGPNEYATKEREYKIRKVLDNDFENELFDDDISNLRRTTTFLQPLANCFTYVLNEGGDPTEGLVSRIMSKYSPLYQQPFNVVLSAATSLGMTINQQNIKSLFNAFLVWDASRKQLIDMSPEYRDYLLYEYPIEFAKKIKDPKFATTKIPSLLIIGDMNNSTKIQSVNFLNAAPRDAKDDFTADLQDQLNTGDLEFFLDLIRYNIMRFGFIWQPKSMYANSPNIIRNLITNYDNLGNIVSMKTLFESPKDLDNLAEIELFLALYMRNNPEDSQIPYIPFDMLKSSKDGNGYIKKGTDFTIDNKKYKTILIDSDIINDPSFDFSPQTTLLLRVGKELYQKMGLEGLDYRYIRVGRLGIQSNYMEYEYTEEGHPLESVCNTIKGLLLKNRTKKIIEGQEEQTSDDNENTARQEDILPYELRLSLQEKEREVYSKMAPIVEALSSPEFNFISNLGRTTVGTKEKALDRFNRLIDILNTTASTNNGEESLNMKEVVDDLNNTIKKYKLC